MLKNHSVTVHGAHFNVSQSGVGEDVLIFLHYFGGSSRSWTEVIERLETDFTCIAIDLRGFGGSNKVPGPYTVERNANDVSAIIDHYAPKRFWMLGHSMGGKFTLAVAARQPKGLQGLVLCAPSPPSMEPMTDQEREALTQAQGQRLDSERILREITGAPLPHHIAERCIEDNLRVAPEAWRAWPALGSREDITDQMEHINVPVEVIAGGVDKGLNEHVLQREVVNRLKDARLQVVDGVGHLIPLEVPERVEAIVREMVRATKS